MNASIGLCRRPTNMTVMRADQNPIHALHHWSSFGVHSHGAPSYHAHSGAVPDFEHDCDSNCLYCWGPETD
jgi:hypothetical protein